MNDGWMNWWTENTREWLGNAIVISCKFEAAVIWDSTALFCELLQQVSSVLYVGVLMEVSNFERQLLNLSVFFSTQLQSWGRHLTRQLFWSWVSTSSSKRVSHRRSFLIRLAVDRVLYQSILIETWLEGESGGEKKVHKQQDWPWEPWEECQ